MIIAKHYDRDDKVVLCTRCKYALQPFSQRVSRYLWQQHAVDARGRRGLYASDDSIELPDLTTLCLLLTHQILEIGHQTR
jgi:hypothetical protein